MVTVATALQTVVAVAVLGEWLCCAADWHESTSKWLSESKSVFPDDPKRASLVSH